MSGQEGVEGHLHHMKEETFSIHHWQPWVYASAAILVLSLVGLLGILLVPVVNRVLYNHLLQFLVAMAAGSLAGDALMHLLPEALGLHVHASSSGPVHNHSDNHHHDHAANGTLHNHTSPAAVVHTHDDAAKTAAVWKCCVCFAGIYMFFLIERLMEIFREYKRRREMASLSLSHITHDHHTHAHCHTHVVGFKFSGTADQCIRTCDDEDGKNGITRNPADSLAMETLLEKPKKEYASNDGREHSTHSNHNHHGHSHGRTASPAPTNIASVAWMVILGDGIHNLIDGLAVGVAFRTVSGGMSTSLAVLLHEIPHELGDFAVLLKSGMSVRLAVFYNLVSSVISFVGMCIGVVLGQSHDATPSWIFALAAGGFLYIALVDLLPDLRPVEARRDESPLWHLGLQNLGLLVGVGIMVVIARFEGDIERAFGS